MFRFTLIMGLFFSFEALSLETNPFTFQSWKEHQVLESQNQVLRISARISSLKSSKGGNYTGPKDASAPLPNSRVKKTEVDPTLAAERDLRRAQESLATANSLSLEDYITVYLPTLQNQPEALHALAQKLSKDELVELFKGLVKKDAPPVDTKRNGAMAAEGLNVTARAKTP